MPPIINNLCPTAIASIHVFVNPCMWFPGCSYQQHTFKVSSLFQMMLSTASTQKRRKYYLRWNYMPSCIQKSKAWVPRPKSCFSIYPNFCKLSPHPKNGNHTCTNPINKQHFTEHLVGALLATNSKGTGAMWLAPSFQNTT